jgi:chemotaxis-related protein WspB
MLLLTFRIREALYALNAAGVVEVIPRVVPRAVPHAPDYLAGVFNYRGIIVPAVDLGVLLEAGPCRARLSTRIILAGAPDSPERLVGLIAESVNDVAPLAPDAALFPPIHRAEAPYLGAVVQLGDDLVQLIVIDKLLPEALRAALTNLEHEIA